MKSIKTLTQLAFKWRDKKARQELINLGLIIPLPKEMYCAFMHEPDEFNWFCRNCFRNNIEILFFKLKLAGGRLVRRHPVKVEDAGA